ncbi:MAG: M48 family metallopeptidase [Deltaproteobacteria bacterium]
MKSKIINSTLKVDEILVPVEVYREFRMDVRTAIKLDKVIIRLPLHYGNADIKKTIRYAEDWVKVHFQKNTALKNRFIIKEHNNGDELLINGVKFILEIKESDIDNYRAKLDKNIIKIEIPYNANILEKKEALVYLQSRIVGQYFLDEIKTRIEILNNKHFKVKINDIKMKYNKTNWGSRSGQGNINICTRLLFAPKEVQDYVFVHELAHFFEMNHSEKFWRIVEKVVPDYKQKEKWLKLNSRKCDF